jgi:ribosomal protein L11 methyltransferase
MNDKYEIDWAAQWAEHSPHFKEGFLHLNLEKYGGKKTGLKLIPGGGFGDLSHPTTELALRLMLPRIKGCLVDIGCGSGILAVGGAASGANPVIAIDIESDALKHTQQNAKLNKQKISVLHPEECSELKVVAPILIVMNMIRSEQKVAWGSLPFLHGVKATMITSGILLEDKAAATEQYNTWGWKVVEAVELKGWLGFVLSNE